MPPGGGFAHLAPGLIGVARSGGYGAVDASSHNARADSFNAFRFGSGPARRFVGVLDPAGIDAGEVIPGGQSGVLGSPHYASQLGRWLTNDYHPLRLTAAAVRDAAVGEQQFTPLCVPGAVTLCFHDRRFRVSGSWQVPMAIGGPTLRRALPSSLRRRIESGRQDRWKWLRSPAVYLIRFSAG